MASFITVPASRKVGKPLPLDAGTICESLAEAEARKFDGMVVYVKDEKKYYCCIDGVVQEFKGASTGTGTGTGASIENFVKTVNGSDFQAVMDTVNTSEVAYYKVEVPATEHGLTNIVYADLVDASYDPVDVSIQINQATQNVTVKTYATEAITGSYILILKGIK